MGYTFIPCSKGVHLQKSNPLWQSKEIGANPLVLRLLMAHRTRGSEHDKAWMCFMRARSRVLTTTGSGHMAQLVLLREVLTMFYRDRASAGAILVPGITCQTMLKSCRNNDQCTCCQDNLCGSFM